MRETVHVLITTYTEPAVTVKECLLRLLVAPEPIYMEKVIYVCDDGYNKAEGPKKREMVEELRLLGMQFLLLKTHLQVDCRTSPSRIFMTVTPARVQKCFGAVQVTQMFSMWEIESRSQVN
jgi:hypothetical protein